MRKITKRFLSFVLMLAMTMTTVLMNPQTVLAATAKTRSTTLAVTSTKISGFKSINGTINLGSKYVIAFGKDKNGKNVYSYSTTGKTFRSAIPLGVEGNVNYQVVKDRLYVIIQNQGRISYKYTSSPATLKSATVYSINKRIKFPDGFEKLDGSVESWGVSDYKSGKLYLTANYYGSNGHEYINNVYNIALNKTSVTVTNVSEKAKTFFKRDNDVRLEGYPVVDYHSSSYRAAYCGTYYIDGVHKPFALITTNGGDYSYTKMLPIKDANSNYNFEWVGSRLMAYRAYYRNPKTEKVTNTLESNSKYQGVYYLYNTSTKKWEKKQLRTHGNQVSSEAIMVFIPIIGAIHHLESIKHLHITVQNRHRFFTLLQEQNGIDFRL